MLAGAARAVVCEFHVPPSWWWCTGLDSGQTLRPQRYAQFKLCAHRKETGPEERWVKSQAPASLFASSRNATIRASRSCNCSRIPNQVHQAVSILSSGGDSQGCTNERYRVCLAVWLFSTVGSSRLRYRADGRLGASGTVGRIGRIVGRGTGSPPTQNIPAACLFPALPTGIPTPAELSLESLSFLSFPFRPVICSLSGGPHSARLVSHSKKSSASGRALRRLEKRGDGKQDLNKICPNKARLPRYWEKDLLR
ncbi:hypothetical protein VUR80DRAFT_3691 [Thermomyces stellatus]